jgi:hypothetical protein
MTSWKGTMTDKETNSAGRSNQLKPWLARLLIGVVFFFNVECALSFIIAPEVYASAFELTGFPGVGMIRGMGILFLMWNVPYAFALWNPAKFHVSLIQATIMQAIGALGETILLVTFPAGHALLRSSVLRFIVFDASGLVFLIVAYLTTLKARKL